LPPFSPSFHYDIPTGKSLATRMEEVLGIQAKFPNKIWVITEWYPKEEYPPLLDKTNQAFYLFVKNTRLANEDGFPCMTYASQEMFGSMVAYFFIEH
uniref:Uncharacterized protein n=1 Tax=Erpetoichthys calabaricus TaxID=27687 RepID=A0A8C4SSI3_ERPCA